MIDRERKKAVTEVSCRVVPDMLEDVCEAVSDEIVGSEGNKRNVDGPDVGSCENDSASAWIKDSIEKVNDGILGRSGDE